MNDQDMLTSFIRKWGHRVSYIRPPEGIPTVKGPDDASWEFLPLAGIERQAKVFHPTFTRSIKPANAHHWHWDDDILEAKFSNHENKLQKFSWNPITGEFLLVRYGFHSDVKGKAPFDDYVRGIVFHDKKRVTFRPFYPTWMQNRSEVQQFHEESPDEGGLEEVSFDAQYACEQALKANGSKGWTFQYNITNRDLEEMTGKHRW